MPIFDSVTRDQYNQEREARVRAEARADALLEKYETLVKQVMEMKRHEQGMMPEGFQAEKMDAMYGLGPKTQSAIERFASGDAELRRYLIGRAHMEYSTRSSESDPQAKDEEVAAIIDAGDTD